MKADFLLICSVIPTTISLPVFSIQRLQIPEGGQKNNANPSSRKELHIASLQPDCLQKHSQFGLSADCRT